jgi:hypothetical protein
MDGALSLRFERNVPYVIAEFNGFQLVQIPHQILAHTSEHTRGEEQLHRHTGSSPTCDEPGNSQGRDDTLRLSVIMIHTEE